ncbi:MAG: type II secretion protein ATPase [Alphaproteobacteria bacterium]|nr:type II secretion protein ATPase [Alphaproteobacteria bacterium]
MSENVQSETSVLLPEARVVIFSEDPETLGVAEGLSADWRFARVEVSAQNGIVAAAIAFTEQYASPDLIIVQTETIDDAFTAQLEELAGHCEEGTAAIVIGPVNDVYLYRKLVDMGVSDYLVKPMTAEILGGVIARALIQKRGAGGSRLVSFIGAKGGLGTSVLAQAMARGLADLAGQKTILTDFAGGWSSMSVGMGFEPVTTLAEAIKAAFRGDQDSLKRMLFNASEKLDVLAHGMDEMFDQGVTPEQIETLLDVLLARTPVIVADLSQSGRGVQKAVIRRSNLIVVTASPTLSSLRLARSLLHEIKDLRGGSLDSVRLLVTMQGAAAGQEVPAKDIAQALDFTPSGTVPYDPKLFLRSENEAGSLLKDPQGAAFVKTILFPLVQNILSVEESGSKDSPLKAAGFFGGLLGTLSRKK